MSALHKYVLRKSTVSLVEQLDPSPDFYKVLLEHDILLPHHVQAIKALSKGVIRDEISLIIHRYLPRRGPQAYKYFLQALQQSSQIELLDILTENEKLLGAFMKC